MNEFASLSNEERRVVFEETSAKLGLPAESVEKDFWVCWTLRKLFELEAIGGSLVFKGGTSLAKAYKLIDRFSEDIDVVVDRERLGFGGEASPEVAPTKTSRRKRMDALKSACQKFVDTELEPALRRSIGVSSIGDFELLKDEADADRMTLLFHYPSVYPENRGSYLLRSVKIELGARSDTWPVKACSIAPYAAEALPDYFHVSTFNVSTIAAERTCLDKMLLLHEENLRPLKGGRKKERLSRHYYDLFRLVEAGVGSQAIADVELLGRVVQHRSLYFAYAWMDYGEFSISKIRLLPIEDSIGFWRDDYLKMRATMFFGDSPSFEKMLDRIEAFERGLRPA